jgi:hypothetical protein
VIRPLVAKIVAAERPPVLEALPKERLVAVRPVVEALVIRPLDAKRVAAESPPVLEALPK